MPQLRTAKGKSPKERLALWHLHSWHLDVPPKACNSRREIQEPKGRCYLAKALARALGKQLETIQHSRNWLRGSTLPQKRSTSTSNIISRSSGNSHQQKWNTCQGFVSLLILASQPLLQRKPDSGQIDCKCVWSPHKLTRNLQTKWYSFG